MVWSRRTVTRLSENHTRGPYEHITPDEKATAGKKAAEIGVAATVKSFSKRFHGCVLKENTVRNVRSYPFIIKYSAYVYLNYTGQR